MSKRFALPALAAGLTLLLVACGSDDKGGTVPADADATIIALDGLVWDASSYTATATDGKVKIAAKNTSSTAHNLHVIDAGGVDNPTSIDLPIGAVEAKEFSLAPGTYTILCQLPGHGEMQATLAVS